MKNKKGFAISGILYTLLLVFLIVVVSELNSLQGKKQVLEQIKTETVDAIDQPWKVELANLQNQINELKNQTNADKIYPIGSIYMSVKNENPSSLFGGTWEAWGSGRVPVGVNQSQTEFVTAEKTGGAMTHLHATQNHVLTIAEMPSHTHQGRTAFLESNTWGGQGYPADNRHNSFQTTDRSGTWTVDGSITYAGGNAAHNHGNTTSTSSLQPYITCYMWKRTA